MECLDEKRFIKRALQSAKLFLVMGGLLALTQIVEHFALLTGLPVDLQLLQPQSLGRFDLFADFRLLSPRACVPFRRELQHDSPGAFLQLFHRALLSGEASVLPELQMRLELSNASDASQQAVLFLVLQAALQPQQRFQPVFKGHAFNPGAPEAP